MALVSVKTRSTVEHKAKEAAQDSRRVISLLGVGDLLLRYREPAHPAFGGLRQLPSNPGPLSAAPKPGPVAAAASLARPSKEAAS